MEVFHGMDTRYSGCHFHSLPGCPTVLEPGTYVVVERDSEEGRTPSVGLLLHILYEIRLLVAMADLDHDT